MNDKKRLGIAAAALTVFGGFAVGSALLKNDEPQPERPTARPSATVVAPTAPADSTSPSVEPSASAIDPIRSSPAADTSAAQKIAEQAIIAYNSSDGRDAKPGDWIKRMQPYTTTVYQARLAKDWSSIAPDEDFTRMREQRLEVRTKINIIDTSDMFPRDEAHITFVADYTGSSRLGTTGDWREGTGSVQRIITMVKQDGDWKVADIAVPKGTN